jgi:hypothetical protein
MVQHVAGAAAAREQDGHDAGEAIGDELRAQQIDVLFQPELCDEGDDGKSGRDRGGAAAKAPPTPSQTLRGAAT